MLFTQISLGIFALSTLRVAAFPSNFKEVALEGAKRAAAIEAGCPFAKREEPLPRLLQEKAEKRKRASIFDASAQYVSTTGAHAYVEKSWEFD